MTQIGYRPDDPMKRAYLSLWMGTGSAVSYEVDTFELLDAGSHDAVYRGEIRLGFAKDRQESIRGGKNRTQTMSITSTLPSLTASVNSLSTYRGWA